MGYMHIDNLYKNKDILYFKECYALEKIHGTSAHIGHVQDLGIIFFSGGEKYDNFVKLFDQEALLDKLKNIPSVYVYGEAYGGKCQGMKETYGPDLRFVAFDVRISDVWLNVPDAEKFVTELGLEFVAYERVSTDLDSLNAERDKPSTQATRNGITGEHKREGVVLRPIMELSKNNGKRICAKHKRDEFRETLAPRNVSVEKMERLADAEKIAREWVTPMRIRHVLDKLGEVSIQDMCHILEAMAEDIKREAEGEVVWSKEAWKAVNSHTAKGVKLYFQEVLTNA